MGAEPSYVGRFINPFNSILLRLAEAVGIMIPKSGFNYRAIVSPIFVLLSLSGLIFSIYILYLATNPYILFLGACFTLLSIVSMVFGIMSAIWYYRSNNYEQRFNDMIRNIKKLNKLPTVAVVIPTYNEDLGMVGKNLTSIKKLNYPKNKIHFYVLDDSSDTKIANGIKALCNNYGVTLIRRDERTGFKAGALNNFLKCSNEEFVAIFDSDERLINKNFLMDLLPLFGDKAVAYVQTEKTYAKGNFFSDSVTLYDSIFYRFIQSARALNNTAIFAGSCGIVRRSMLSEVGGFPEYVVEDTFLSFESKIHGYKNIYVPKVYALGKPINSFTEFAKQQWRYNYGGTQFLSYFIKKGEFKKRSILSNLDYLTHGFGLNYISIVLLIYSLLTAGIIFSAIPILNTNIFSAGASSAIVGLELLGLFSFSLSMLTPVLLSKVYFNSWKKGLMVFFLNYALAIVRAKAAIATIFNANPTVNWNKLNIKNSKGKLLDSIYNTKAEITFAVVFSVLALVSYFGLQSPGAAWIGFYAVMFSLATIFIYKYG